MKLKQIHKDDRGEVSILVEDLHNYEEVTVFKTYTGYARGGCVHNINKEFVCVIEGVIDYYLGYKTGTEKIRLLAGDTLEISKEVPHYYFSNTDSVVLEWGATPEEKKNKHLEFRKIVDEINAKKQASEMM